MWQKGLKDCKIKSLLLFVLLCLVICSWLWVFVLYPALQISFGWMIYIELWHEYFCFASLQGALQIWKNIPSYYLHFTLVKCGKYYPQTIVIIVHMFKHVHNCGVKISKPNKYFYWTLNQRANLVFGFFFFLKN